MNRNRVIINNRIFNIDESELVLKYTSIRETKFYGRVINKGYLTNLYRTKKGSWFEEIETGDEKVYCEVEISKIKQILKELNQIDIYHKYFEQLEEA